MFIHPIGIDRVKELLSVEVSGKIRVVLFNGEPFIIDGHHRYFLWWLNRFAERGDEQKRLVQDILGAFRNAPTEESRLESFFNQLNEELSKYSDIFFGEFLEFMLEKPLPPQAEIVEIETETCLYDVNEASNFLFGRDFEFLVVEEQDKELDCIKVK